MLNESELKTLLEVAEKATPGPWRAVALLADAENHHVLAGQFSDRHIKATADDHNGLVAFADLPANTNHIATFDPTTCAALVREVLELKQIHSCDKCDLCEDHHE